MAKTLKEEDLRLNIIVNGDPARKEIGQLTRNITDLRSANGKLLAEQKKLKAEESKDKARLAEIQIQRKQNNATIKENEARIKQLRSEMKLTSMTTGELSQRHSELRVALRNVVPGTSQWKKINAEILAVNTRMSKLAAESTKTGGVMCRMADTVNKYIGSVAASITLVTIYTGKLMKSVEDFSALDEAMAGTRKTTGMTEEEVRDLNDTLSKFDTRTAQNGLLSLGRIGGKLGIPEENIEGFVRAGDIIKTALGQDLGGDVEQTIGQVGKLVNVFQLTKEMEIDVAMLKTASAMNELGKSSTANEAYIVDFLRRVGGVSVPAKLAIADMAGLGATLDDVGVSVEVAGTSISQVITGMYRKTDAFARAAGMSVKDFKALLRTDTNEAILRFAEGVGGNDSEMARIVKVLDSLGLKGQRTTQVLTALAMNAGKVREQQAIANKAFDEGTSVMEEFNILNNTTEATTEKLKKEITAESAALGESLVPAYHASLSAKASLLAVTRTLIEWIINNKGAIIALMGTYLIYQAMLKADIVAKKLQIFFSGAHRVALLREVIDMKAATAATVKDTAAKVASTSTTKLFTAAQLLLAGSFRAAGVAFKLFLKSIGPIGWIVGALGALGTALAVISSRTTAASRAQKIHNGVMERAAEIEDEHGVNLVGKAEKINRLMQAVESETTAEKDRLAAIKELQGLIPDGINLINNETIANGEAAKAVRAYTDELILQATLKAALQRKEELIEQAGKDRVSGKDSKGGFFGWLARNGAKAAFGNNMDLIVEGVIAKNYQERLNEELTEIDKIYADTQEKLAAKKLIVPDSIEVEDPDKEGDGDFGGGGNSQRKWSLDNDAAFLEEKRKLRQRYADGEIATEQEHQDKLLNLEIAALQARLAVGKEAGADREKLEIQLSDKLIEQKKREQQLTDAAEDLRIQNMTDATERENAEHARRMKQHAGNLAAQDQLVILHNRNLTKIELDKALAGIKLQQDEYTQGRQIMQERHKAELLDSSLSKTEKVRLKREQANELKAYDEEYYRAALEQLRSLDAEGSMSFRNLKGVLQTIDIDTALLSEEEKNDLLRRIREAQNAIDAAAEQVDALGAGEDGGYSFLGNSGGSLFGLSQDDWGTFFQNLKDGKFGIEDLAAAFVAVQGAATMALDLAAGYDKLMTARENAELKRFKKNQDQKKKLLQSRLDAGLMTEEQHTQATEEMDAEYERKQEELQIKQAKRQKAMTITQAIINTAAGVVTTLAQWGIPWGLIPAGIMAAMGAAQIAMIAATPITGAEVGGFAVERAQDGKRFNAKVDPGKRGYVDKPTVLVGENGMEYVIPNEAMQNPTAMPIISMIEVARQRGRLRDFDFTAGMYGMMRMPGYAIGGPVGGAMPAGGIAPGAGGTDDSLPPQIYQMLALLNRRLQGPITAEVSLMGRNGFNAKMDEYDRMKRKGKIGL